jgi:uncharacterized protein (DUF305 family)
MKHHLTQLCVAVTAALALAGCGGASQPEVTQAAGKDQTTFNQADADFIPAMNQLLSQATTLGEIAEQRASSHQVRGLATTMNAAHFPQFDQIVARGQEVTKQPGLTHTHDHGESAHTIPGYLPEADVDAMTAAKGRSFDRAFLTLMIKHHDGSIAAARTEQDQGSHRPTKDLAREIEATLTEHKQELEANLARLAR